MKKYRVKPYKSSLGVTRYAVEFRYFLISWVHIKDFMKEEDAIAFYNKLNQKN